MNAYESTFVWGSLVRWHEMSLLFSLPTHDGQQTVADDKRLLRRGPQV